MRIRARLQLRGITSQDVLAALAELHLRAKVLDYVDQARAQVGDVHFRGNVAEQGYRVAVEGYVVEQLPWGGESRETG